MIENRLQKQIEFIVEVDKLKDIFRRTMLTNGLRNENDAEHSWHLALMAPLLSEYIEEEVDLLKVIKMVIIHDLVEIDAGDTYCYDIKGNEDKREREEKAAERIFNLLPKEQGEEIYNLWIEFEEIKTIEAKYAATLDRLQPLLLNYYTGGKSWINNGRYKHEVLGRMDIIRQTSPKLWELVSNLIDKGVDNGWLKE